MSSITVLYTLESPLFVGGKRIKDNVLQSIDYIPGNVMRAAFAKTILMSCQLFQPDVPDSEGRYNMVYVRDKDQCASCPNYKWCNNFSNIKFSFFYPENFEIAPKTTKKCKNNKDHKLLDSLIKDGKAMCSDCQERVEGYSGYIRDGKPASLKRMMITRTAIDKYTRTAKNGSLFSLNAIKPNYDFGGVSQELVFKGEISGADEEMIRQIDIVRVGKYVSTGMGRLSLKAVHSKTLKTSEKLIAEIEEYNKINTNECKVKYIPLLFKSDAKLGKTDQDVSKPLTNKEYLLSWTKLLFGSEGESFSGQSERNLKIEKVFAGSDILRGFDTAKGNESWEKEPELITRKGSVFLLSTRSSLQEAASYLISLEEKGIGNDTINGFGQIEVMSKTFLEGRKRNDK